MVDPRALAGVLALVIISIVVLAPSGGNLASAFDPPVDVEDDETSRQEERSLTADYLGEWILVGLVVIFGVVIIGVVGRAGGG